MKSVEVEIFGKKFWLKGDSPEKIRRYADFLNDELNELQSKITFVDHSKILALVSMIITEKYFNEVEKNKGLKAELNRLNKMIGDFIIEENI